MYSRLFTLLVIAVLCAAPAAASSRPSAPRLNRVRIADESISRLLEQGLNRSITIRRLISEIETGGVFVYLCSDTEMNDRLAGHMKFLGSSGRYRYVKVAIRRPMTESEAIAALGHELEHVREILMNPQVKDGSSLEDFYRQVGDERTIAGRRSVDTEAARRTGIVVRRELQ